MSFSQDTKQLLSNLVIKNKCCKRSFARGKECFSADLENYTSFLEEEKTKLQCPQCNAHFLRGVFLEYGSITDPQSGYHLEFVFKEEQKRDALVCLMEDLFGGIPKKGQRKSLYLAYFKESATIEDFLAYIGASKAVFDYMNNKIFKEIRNNANRVANCEAANIDKSISASQKYIAVIKSLKESGDFSKLPPNLQQSSELRLEFEEASLTELGKKMDPPISKSGMTHRLSKIMEYYQQFKQEKR